MGFSVEYSGLVVTYLMYKAAIILVVVRWLLSCGLRYTGLSSSSGDPASSSSNADQAQHTLVGPPCSSSVCGRTIRDSLHVVTYKDIAERLPESCTTCAVCLNELRKRDKVRELRNCCHVFHKRCIDRWLNHDAHKSCPLCRAPLLASFSTLPLTRSDPSWAVERLLYLFGDDLLL